MPKKADTSKHQAILDDISSGMSVRKACERHDVNHWTFVQAVDESQYARARDMQADTHFEEMADLEQQCKDGTLDPQAFRALLDSRKWRLARMRPKVYGDTTKIEHSGQIATMTQEQNDAAVRAALLAAKNG